MIKDYVLNHMMHKLKGLEGAIYEIDPGTGYGDVSNVLVEGVGKVGTNPQVKADVLALLSQLPDDFELVAILTGDFYDEGSEGTQFYFAGEETQKRVWANKDAVERIGFARHTEMLIMDSFHNPKEYRILMVSDI